MHGINVITDQNMLITHGVSTIRSYVFKVEQWRKPLIKAYPQRTYFFSSWAKLKLLKSAPSPLLVSSAVGPSWQKGG